MQDKVCETIKDRIDGLFKIELWEDVIFLRTQGIYLREEGHGMKNLCKLIDQTAW